MLGELGKYFPDEGQHLLLWARHFRAATVQSLMDMLRYDGPVELLSMCLCFYQAGTDAN